MNEPRVGFSVSPRNECSAKANMSVRLANGRRLKQLEAPGSFLGDYKESGDMSKP